MKFQVMACQLLLVLGKDMKFAGNFQTVDRATNISDKDLFSNTRELLAPVLHDGQYYDGTKALEIQENGPIVKFGEMCCRVIWARSHHLVSIIWCFSIIIFLQLYEVFSTQGDKPSRFI